MRFELYPDATDEYRWRLVDAEGRSMAESPVSYPTRKACVAAIELVRCSGAAYVLDLARDAERLRAKRSPPGSFGAYRESLQNS